MRNQPHKPRHSRTSRLEVFKSRELLSNLSVPLDRAVEVSPMAKAHGETITGKMSGTCSISASGSGSGRSAASGSSSMHYHGPTGPTPGSATFVATGSLTILGPASLTGSDSYSVLHHEVKYTHGSMTLSDSSGDQIDVSFKGSGKASANGVDTFKVNGPVTGGAGMHIGAAGTFSASGSFNSGTDAFSIRLTIKLDQPGHHPGNADRYRR